MKLAAELEPERKLSWRDTATLCLSEVLRVKIRKPLKNIMFSNTINLKSCFKVHTEICCDFILIPV